MSFPRYPKYKHSGGEWLGEVPEHWIAIHLKRLVDPLRPITYGIVQAGPDVADGIPYIRPADMQDEAGIASQDQLLKTSHEIAAAYTRSKLQPGDLVCSIGPSFGKVMVVPDWLEGANLTQGTARIAVHREDHPRYVFWCLRSAPCNAQWESSVGGATFRALNLGPLADTVIAYPPFSEQATIAAFLDRETAKIDALIAEQQRLIELLEEKRQAVISHAVTKGLNPDAPMKDSGVEWLGQVPAHWEVVSLKRFMHLKSGEAIAGERIHDDGPVPVFGGNGLRGFTDVFSHDGDYVLIGRQGALCGNINYAHGKFWASEHAVVVRPLRVLDLMWLGEMLRSMNLNQYSVSAAQPGLSVEALGGLRSCVPPVEEQQHIGQFLEQQTANTEKFISESKHAISLLQERRSALISAAVTGQIDVRGFAEMQAA